MAAINAVGSGTNSVASAVDSELSSSWERAPGQGGGSGDPVDTSGGGSGGGSSGYDDGPYHDTQPGGGAPNDDDSGSGGGGAGGSGGNDGDGDGGTDNGGGGNGSGNDGGGNDSEQSGGSDEDSGGNDSGSGGSSGSGGNEKPPAEQVDFTFDDLEIGCWHSNRAVSNWMTFNFPDNRSFDLRGEGNPTAQNAQGQHSQSGEVRWGTNIRVDIPEPGTSRTVYMDVGDEVGSFTVNRADCT